MSRQERIARLSLAVVGVAIGTFCVLLLILGVKRATGAFGLLGLLGLVPVFLYSDRRGGVVFDERDAAIQVRALQIAYAAFWLVFVGVCMGIWAFYGDRGMIPAQILPIFPLVGWMVVTVVQSIATLVQYARGR